MTKRRVLPISKSAACIYARVSSEEQARGDSIQTQLQACREYCARMQWPIVAEFLDEAVSGSMPMAKRPNGGPMMAVATGKQPSFGKVVVYKFDRIARSMEIDVLARVALEQAGIDLISVNEPIDDSPSGELLRNIHAAFAQHERAMITLRTRDGKRRLIREGRWFGPVPFGHRLTRDRKTIEPDPKTTPVVKMMFEMALHTGLYALITKLNELGIPPPDPKRVNRKNLGWSGGGVHYILKNRAYIGEAQFGEGAQMQCPPIIDKALFDRVQTALLRRRDDSMRNTAHFYLLQHRLRCRFCGRRFGVATRKLPSGHTAQFYKCGSGSGPAAQRGTHSAAGVRSKYAAGPLEARVKQLVTSLWTDPDAVEAYVSTTFELIAADLDSVRVRLHSVEAALHDLHLRERRLVDLAGRGLIREAALIEQMDEITADRERLTAEQTTLQAEASTVVDQREGIEEVRRMMATGEVQFVRDADQLAAMPHRDWADVLDACADRIWVETDGSITIEGPGRGVGVSERRPPFDTARAGGDRTRCDWQPSS